MSTVCSGAILHHGHRVVVGERDVQEVIARAQLVYVHCVATVNVKEQRLVTGLLLVYGHVVAVALYVYGRMVCTTA